jgi:hypothetical protein
MRFLSRCKVERKRKQQYDIGKKRVKRQLELLPYLKRQMLDGVLGRTMFSKVERFMARRQYKTFILDENVKSSSSDSDNNVFEMKDFIGALKYVPILHEGMLRPAVLQEWAQSVVESSTSRNNLRVPDSQPQNLI